MPGIPETCERNCERENSNEHAVNDSALHVISPLLSR